MVDLGGMDDRNEPSEKQDTALPPVGPREARSYPLGPREELVAQELRKLDPALEGLFRGGHEFCDSGQPGHTYFVAIAGRELSRGIVNALALRAPELNVAESTSIGANERHRGPIARALQLHPKHPIVDLWHELHSRFSSEGKYVPHRETPSSAVSDFRMLSSLLIGRLTPYFREQDEADSLLGVANPGPEHVEAVRRVLVRPSLKRYFFKTVTRAAWLPVLSSLKVFSSPPRRRVHANQSWSVVPWVEGEYLARVAADEPEKVAEILSAIPADNDNPAVWDIAARAGMQMPPATAVPILKHIVKGIPSQPHVVFAGDLVALGKHTVEADPRAALALIDALLAMRRRSELLQPGENEEELSNRLRFSTRWLLARIDQYEAQELFKELVPAIAKLNPKALLGLLKDKLRASMEAMDPDYESESARRSLWLHDFGEDDSEDGDDFRSVLARHIARVATIVAKADPANEGWLDKYFASLPSGIGERIRLHVIANAQPSMVKHVNAVLSRPDVLASDTPGREVGEVLRSRFADAAPEAQSAFLRALERGPNEEELEWQIEHAKEWDMDSSVAGVTQAWQRRHLSRFGSNLPPILQTLADRIEYRAKEIDLEQLDLIEIGWSSRGGASWVRDRSPLDSDRLATGAVEDIAREIVAWDGKNSDHRVSLRGLDDALQELAKTTPVRGVDLALGLRAANTTRGMPGILRGLRESTTAAQLPPDRLIELLNSGLSPGIGLDAAERRNVHSAAIDFVERVITPNAPLEVVDRAVDLGAKLIGDASSWIDTEKQDASYESLDAIITTSINVTPGQLVHMLVRAALRQVRERGDAARQATGARLDEALAPVLEKEGRLAVAARAAIGDCLPQLLWLSPDWWRSRLDELLRSGLNDPLSNPIWAAYLVRGGYYDDSFAALRRYYAAAASAGPRLSLADKSRTWEPEPHLVSHVLVAVVRNKARLGEPDALVENTFSKALAEDASHTYWEIFRGWSNAKEEGKSVPSDFVGRLVAFWEWRLSQLESAPVTKRTSEEAAGLLWFCRTPFLQVEDIIRLGTRTLALLREAGPTLHSLWKRLAELALVDPDGAFVMLDKAISLELTAQWAHFPMKELEAVFRTLFDSGSQETRDGALALLDRLGDAGYHEFGKLRPKGP